MNIESCNTWQCVNSFATWISALGTTAISGLALWLSVRDKIVRLDSRLSIAQIPGDNPKILDRWAYMISFINVGVRPVTINNFEWRLKSYPFGKLQIKVTFPHMNQKFSLLCTKFPTKGRAQK